MKANFKINKDEKSKNDKPVKTKKDVTNEEFEKNGMNVWTYRSKSKLIKK